MIGKTTPSCQGRWRHASTYATRSGSRAPSGGGHEHTRAQSEGGRYRTYDSELLKQYLRQAWCFHPGGVGALCHCSRGYEHFLAKSSTWAGVGSLILPFGRNFFPSSPEQSRPHLREMPRVRARDALVLGRSFLARLRVER